MKGTYPYIVENRALNQEIAIKQRTTNITMYFIEKTEIEQNFFPFSFLEIVKLQTQNINNVGRGELNKVHRMQDK